MKECKCPHPHYYCDFKATICQPSEEKDQYGHKIERPNIPDDLFDKVKEKLKPTQGECNVQYKCICHTPTAGRYTVCICCRKPNSTALEDWEIRFDREFETYDEDGNYMTMVIHSRKEVKSFIQSLLASQREETERSSQIDLLQRQRGVMGKYNCNEDCIFDKKYFDLVQKELDKLS